MSAFLDTETVNGGRLSPCAANDFATAANYNCTIIIDFKRCIKIQDDVEQLQIRSNCRIINMVTTYAVTAGDHPITDMNFGLVYENDDFSCQQQVQH